MSLTFHSVLRKLYTEPSIGAFRNRPIRENNCLWRPCLLTYRDEMSNIYRRSPIDNSFQVSIHLAKRWHRREFFRNWPIRNKNCMWRPCLLTHRAEMSNLYREPSIYASYQVSGHIAMQFQRTFFTNRPIRNNNFLWRPCLLTDREELNTAYRGSYIDASYQASVHLAKGFQRRRLNVKSLQTNDDNGKVS